MKTFVHALDFALYQIDFCNRNMNVINQMKILLAYSFYMAKWHWSDVCNGLFAH